MDDDNGDDDVGSAQQATYLEDDNGYWYQAPVPNNVPVCWKNPSGQFTAQKQIIKDAILSSWDAMSALTFTGWNTCPLLGNYVSVEIVDDQSDGDFQGRTEPGYGLVTLQDLTTATKPSIKLRYDLTSSSPDPKVSSDQQIRQLAYHEFGHALGFHHENDRVDAGDCYDEPSEEERKNDLDITEFDPWSIMAAATCREDRPSSRRPSGMDILANQLIHGSPSQWTHATRNFCVQSGDKLYVGDFNDDGRDDLLCNQPDGDMFVDLANNFGEFAASDWSLGNRDFCIESGDKLYVGDFNGDGRDDLLCNQPDGDMFVDHANANGQFLSTNWAQLDRNFCHLSTDKMYVGDFNGDGRDDLLCNRSDGDMLAALANVNGQFLVTDWTLPDRNFCIHSSEKLYVGDFNGDEKDDLVCIRSNGEMRVDHADANGQFLGSDWIQLRNFCHTSSGKLLVADFNGDRRDDLACFTASTGWISFELADESGRFDEMDMGSTPAPQPDARGPLAEWCKNATLFVGQFNSVSTGGRAHLPGRADLLCQKSSGSMSIQYDFSMPALSETGLSVAEDGWVHFGPFTVWSGGELNAFLTRPTAVGASTAGDVDLYVRKDSQPTLYSYDCDSRSLTSFERCRVTTPGDYYVSIFGYDQNTAGLSVQVFLESFGIFTPDP